MFKISERIKQRREHLGISAEIVAERCGISPATIYRYESGFIKNMRLDKVELLSKALLCSPAYLMEWEDEKKLFNKPKYPELEKILDEMNEEGVQKVYSYAVDISRQYKKHCSHRMVEGKE